MQRWLSYINTLCLVCMYLTGLQNNGKIEPRCRTNIVYGLYKNKDWCDGRLGCFSDGINCLFTICVRCADCNSAAANNAMPVEIAGTELSQTFYILHLTIYIFHFLFYILHFTSYSFIFYI